MSAAAKAPGVPAPFVFLAVAHTDSQVGDDALCVYNSMKHLPQNAHAVARDWNAYRRLMQLTGILTTARIDNADRVWKQAVQFIEDNEDTDIADVALAVQHGLAPAPKNTQSPAPAASSSTSVASKAAGCVAPLRGVAATPTWQGLTPEMQAQILANKEAALQRKRTREEAMAVAAGGGAEPIHATPHLQRNQVERDRIVWTQQQARMTVELD